jgi:hypothetical protein
LVEEPECIESLFLFFSEKEKESKETARVPRILRFVAADGARGNSPLLRFSFGAAQTVRALYSDRTADARRGTKGHSKH